MTKDGLSERDVAAAWDRNAARWADSVRAGHDLYREHYTLPAFLDFMPPVAGRRVLGLGCGEGANTRRFAELGGRLTGIDISEALIARARDEERRAPLGITYEVCSFAEITIARAASYDVVLSTMALMDGPHFEQAMTEAHRVLVPGGTLSFSVLHPCFITRNVQWDRSEDGGYRGLKVGRYFEDTPFVETWRFNKHPVASQLPDFQVPRFPRTLSDIVNGVCAAGFTIAEIAEPRPSAAMAETFPWLARWREHAPMVLYLSASKPGG